MLQERIKTYRINKGYSQEKLAELAGVNLRTIQRIESGETDPRGDTIIRLAEALGTTPGNLIDFKLMEDTGYLNVMNLSALLFLLFPLLSIIVPLIMWITKKDQISHADTIGKEILNFQITWNLIFFPSFFGYYFWYFHQVQNIMNITPGAFTSLLTPIFYIIGVTYTFNILIILLNTFLINRDMKTFFYPRIRFMR